MDLPPFLFSDQPVPPSKAAQTAVFYDVNRKTIIPVGKDAFLNSISDLSSLSFKYSPTAANEERVLRPLSTCLPLGSPNRVANLQDLCSGTLPFAVQAQQWIRQCNAKRPVGRPGKGKKAQNSTGKKSVKAKKVSDEESAEEDEDVQMEEEDPELESSEAASAKKPARQRGPDLSTEMEAHGDVDPLLPFGNLASIPDFRNFKPFSKDNEVVAAQGKRATVHAGFSRMPPLNSPINWWYSGGSVSYLSTAPYAGVVFHAVGALTRVSATAVNVTTKRSFRRIETVGRVIEAVQLKAPIYQIESHFMDGEAEALVYARLPDETVVLGLDTASDDGQLYTKYVFPTTEYDYFTHVAASPYVSGEFITASQLGIVTFHSLDVPKPVKTFTIAEMEFKKSAKYNWTGCYFGAHPRDICVATPCAVELFDGRLRANNTKPQRTLLVKGSDLSNVANDIIAATLFNGRDSYHVVATTREIVVVDSRFPAAPVLRYPAQATTSPSFLRTLSDVATGSDVILTGSQMSQQVMCFELDLGAPGGAPAAARIAAIPFLAATPRQLVPQAVEAEVRVELTSKQRLEKPIIGLDGIIHPGGDGFTILTLTALGDLFMQSFESIEKGTYVADGTEAFSTVHSDAKLSKKEKKYLSKWLIEADAEVMDPTMNDYVRPFVPDVDCRIGEEMTTRAAQCAAALVRKPHPLCRECIPNLVVEDDAEIPEGTCSRCTRAIKTSRITRSTGDNRFCFVEENDSTTPITLPSSLQRDDRLREMGKTNRIVWKILTKCYGEDIPAVNLQPEARDMPPPIVKPPRAKKRVALNQDELHDLLMQDTLAVGDYHAGEAISEPQENLAPLPSQNGAPFAPLATSTQNQREPDQDHMEPVKSAKKSKKPKRAAGF